MSVEAWPQVHLALNRLRTTLCRAKNPFTIAELVLRAPQAALRYSLIKPWTTCLRLIRAVTSTD